MTVTNFMINDNEPSDKAKILINRFNSEKDNSLDNIISGRNLINKIIIAYDG